MAQADSQMRLQLQGNQTQKGVQSAQSESNQNDPIQKLTAPKEPEGGQAQQTLMAPQMCGGIQPLMQNNRLMPYNDFINELQKL